MSLTRLELRRELLALLVLTLLPLVWFWPVIFGGQTLLPADNIYQYEPWRSFAQQQGVGQPHNELLSDLVLQNYPWKRLIREAIAGRQLPLWNPYLFTGVPFLAAGQHSALYPLSLVYYILPLPMAYGVFTWLTLALAGINMYLFARILGIGRAAALFAGIVYMFSGFFIASVVFPMMIAAAAWLPLLLALIEMVVRKQEEKGNAPFVPVAYIVGGAIVLGLSALAGHVEITYYTLLVAAMYSLWRLFGVWRRLGVWRPVLRMAGWLLFMAVTGLLLAAIQLIPLYELVTQNFREGSVGYAEVVGWAWPTRQILTFLVPDLFGNPAHHTLRDWWTGETVTVWRNAFGQETRTVFWGVKNYVEGANYLGILTLVLAVAAFFDVGGRLRGEPVRQPADRPGWVRPPTGRFFVVGFALLAVLALAFAFGTPLYALLFYGLPGYKQLHSAFRWVFPYTLAMAVLAGFGFDRLQLALEGIHLARLGGQRRFRWLTFPDSARLAGVVLTGVGAVVLGLLLLSRYWPAPFIALGERVIASSDLAQAVFADGAQFWSYEAVHFLQFGFMLLASGLILLLALSPFGQRRVIGPVDERAEERALADQGFTWSVGLRLWQAVALVIIFLDLWLVGAGFNPRAEPAWLDFRPPAVLWLERHQDPAQPWRFTTLQDPFEQKTYNANLGMYSRLHDVRGYDSIIPRQYAAYMGQIQTQGDLLYNRIAPIYMPNLAALDDPLFHLLGVRYVVTTQTIPNPDYRLVYEGEVRIYENLRAFPRVLFVPQAIRVEPERLWETIRSQDLRQTVVLDTGLAETRRGVLPDPVFGHKRDARVRRYDLNDVEIEVDVDAPGWLVLNDAYFPGWRAYVRPLAAVDTGQGIQESELTIYRANGNFRAVYLAQPGWQLVRFHYTPLSFKLGIYTSFLAGVFLLLLVGWWAWGRFYREEEGETGAVRRVAVNSLVPMTMSLVNKGIDYAFALLYMRVLNPAGVGAYSFAIQFYTLFEIVVRFGLGTLLTREVARRRQSETEAGRYLGNVLVLRTLLWLASLPLMAVVAGLYRQAGAIDDATVVAIGIFALALFFANLSDAFSSVFYAFERMEYPAGVASFVALARVTLGAFVLLLGGGFVGLAAVSLLMNVFQAVWLYGLVRRRILRPRLESDWSLQRWMLGESLPLMVNHLLATAFWRVDILILTAMVGAYGVGLYSAAYKYIDGLNVLPSYFTLAVFPVMARLAGGNGGDGRDLARLMRTYRLSLRLLTMLAIPIAVLVFFAAEPLIIILGGREYVPGAVVALQILILSIPIGFMNSLTHYVLIAVGQQRFLTGAFVIGVGFNIVANLLAIPRYGVAGAAFVTILSEFALFFPFYYAVRRHLAPLPWFDLLWRQVLAGLLMAATFLLVTPFSLLLALPLACAVYGLGLVLTGAHRSDDMAIVYQALPRFRLPFVSGMVRER
ncbi:MAG: oligosaccharide flippase family protein [Caldilineales bacterium]|nr:oligosaccharide flippase family protein [Caldilineales bacterium]